MSVCVCVCLSVKSDLTSGVFVCPENIVTYSAGNGGQNICRVFSKTASFKSYGIIWHPKAMICATFRWQSFLKLKKANNRLNTTWNTTQCKASFFLFSLRLLPTNLPLTRISVMRELFRIHARVAPRVLHISAFIVVCNYLLSAYTNCNSSLYLVSAIFGTTISTFVNPRRTCRRLQ